MTKHKSIIYPDTLKQLLMFVLLSLSSVAMAADRIVLEFGGIKKTSELRLSIGKSQIIYSQQPLDQVVIGNPEIADIKLLSSRQVLILGNKPGHTNLVFRDKDRSNIALMDVVVGYDLEGVKRKLYEVMPQEELIQVRGANDAVMLSGEVSSALALDVAVAVAASYVPKNKVINMLQVGGGQQVMVEVKIAEISRSAAKDFGIGLEASHGSGAQTYNYSNGVAATGAALNSAGTAFVDGTRNFGAFSLTDLGGDLVDSLTVRLRIMEGKGLAKTLAEPNLVAMSGQEASFLAGGEFPYTATGVGTAETIFKEFGVGLKFTPTVLNSEKINIKLSAEVSSLGSPFVGGEVPISTRRAATTIEMADGQSFAIAGLLQSDIQNSLNQVPGLGDIPILGALFRSTAFQRQETELVIIVTPRLVKPVAAGTLVAPTDNFIPTSWLDQYLLGNLEGTADRVAKSDKSARSKQTDSGLEGEYGHKVYEPATNEKGAMTDKSDQYEEKANGQ
jgi:pilus assembly protein CpaC